MGLFEFLFERRNPGPVGRLDLDGPDPDGRGPMGLRAFVALLMCGGWVLLLTQWTDTIAALALALVLSALYLVVGYFVRPVPDYSNLGWYKGLLFDHPFRWSDDANRALLFLKVLLWPGQFVSTALVDVVMAGRS